MATAAEYIQQVLSSRGPQAPPYAEPAKWIIKEHLLELQKVFPSLAIRSSEFHANDGRQTYLLKAVGTIPIHYQGHKYNIPVAIWLMDRYPYQAPLVYVVPTANMTIRPGHGFVDSNGQVLSKGVRGWQYPNSNLVDLVLEMAHAFGNDPPLYSQPGASSGTAASGAAAAAYGRPPAPSMGAGPATVQPPQGYPGYGQQPQQQQQQQQPGPPAPWGAPPPGYAGASMPATTPGAGPGSTLDSSAAANPIWGAAYAAAFGPRPPAGAAYPGQAPPPQGAPGTYGSQQQQQPPPPPLIYPPPFPGPPSTGGSSATGSSMPYGVQPPPPPPPPHIPPPPQGQPQSTPQPPPPPPPPPPPAVKAEELQGTFRRLAVDALKVQLDAAEKRYTDQAQQETESQLEVQRMLLERKQQMQAAVTSLKAEREGTEGAVKDMGGRVQALQQWLERNEPKAQALEAAGGVEAIDWDKALTPADELSRAALEAQAADLAYEDTILALDKALQAGMAGLSLDAYLKQVRALCRKQFFSRAMGLKVADMQRMQPPPPPPPPGAGVSTPLPLPHGDSWAGAGMLGAPSPRPPGVMMGR